MKWQGLMFRLIVFQILACPIQAQNKPLPYGNEAMLDSLLKSPTPSVRDDDVVEEFIGLGANYPKFALLASGKKAYGDFLRAIEDARLDKESGSTPSSEGSTSLVSKGIAPRVLGLAVEHGALARTDEGSVATFRGNALGVARAISGAEQFPYCAVHDQRCRNLKRRFLEGLSFHVSFDASRQEDNGMAMAADGGNENILRGNTRQISAWGVRYDSASRRRNFEQTFIEKWREKITDPILIEKAKTLLKETEKAFSGLQLNAQYSAWLAKYVPELKSDANAATEDQVRAIAERAGLELVEIAREVDPDFDAKTKSVLASFASYFGTRDRLLSDAVNKVTFAFEYTNIRPLNEPSQSTFRGIVSGRPTEKTLITFNGAFTIYDTLPEGAQMGRWRDAQIAFQADRRLGKLGQSVNTDLSGGYYYQYMAEDALLEIPAGNLAPGTAIPLPGDASVLLNTKGHIHLGQVKLTFSIKGTGVKLPVAVTFSNRTDLIKASEVRANFGITYDLDNLFAKK